MKKTLLALMTAGTIGCGGYTPPYLPNSVQLNPNEVSIFSEVNEKTRSGEYCRREVFLGMKWGNLQSVVMTEHCKNLKDDQGMAYAQRYEDTDNDGFADEICHEEVVVSYGLSQVASLNCFNQSFHEVESSMTCILGNMLRGVLDVRYK